jgi:citronellol/citronellal dehydrogenase
MKLLQGKIALVTGASRGIGMAIAQRFASEGATVIVTARTLEAHDHLPGSLMETVELITEAGGKAYAIQADMTDFQSRDALVKHSVEKFGPIDILVNNAAACFYLPIENLSDKRTHIIMEVNFHAPFHLSQLVLPGMRKKKQGWILNISSATSKTLSGPPYKDWDSKGGAMLYGSSKAALNRFSAGLAAETYVDNIVVNSMAPKSGVVTPGLAALESEGHDLTFVPEPVEAMAEAALLLCSCDIDQHTGENTYSIDLLKTEKQPVKHLDGSGEIHLN